MSIYKILGSDFRPIFGALASPLPPRHAAVAGAGAAPCVAEAPGVVAALGRGAGRLAAVAGLGRAMHLGAVAAAVMAVPVQGRFVRLADIPGAGGARESQKHGTGQRQPRAGMRAHRSASRWATGPGDRAGMRSAATPGPGTVARSAVRPGDAPPATAAESSGGRGVGRRQNPGADRVRSHRAPYGLCLLASDTTHAGRHARSRVIFKYFARCHRGRRGRDGRAASQARPGLPRAAPRRRARAKFPCGTGCCAGIRPHRLSEIPHRRRPFDAIDGGSFGSRRCPRRPRAAALSMAPAQASRAERQVRDCTRSRQTFAYAVARRPLDTEHRSSKSLEAPRNRARYFIGRSVLSLQSPASDLRIGHGASGFRRVSCKNTGVAGMTCAAVIYATGASAARSKMNTGAKCSFWFWPPWRVAS
ncbi:hypothetical protein JHFBIEKO_1206 [Methylobacterium mesophilicum]|nr:hypothetical protein JHFBIEKO_1206 [Methylobacterium mesophilicum]